VGLSVAVNLPAMTNRKQINFASDGIIAVNHSVITDSQPAFVRSNHPMMLKSPQPRTHVIQLRLNPRLDGLRQPEIIIVVLA